MPELPDVEAIRRRVDRDLSGHRVTSVEVRVPQGKKIVGADLQERLSGRRITGTARHGKWMFVTVDGKSQPQAVWALHFGMTGDLKRRTDGDAPRHARLSVALDDDRVLDYTSRRRLGENVVADSIDAFVRARGLGPDALKVKRKAFVEQLSGRTGNLKGTLMDQSVVAGIGNVYADEVLHQERLHPQTRLDALDDKRLGRIHTTMQHVLKKAVEVRAEPDRMPRSWLLPHRQAEAPCPRCGAPLHKSTVQGRPTYHCPREAKQPAA